VARREGWAGLELGSQKTYQALIGPCFARAEPAQLGFFIGPANDQPCALPGACAALGSWCLARYFLRAQGSCCAPVPDRRKNIMPSYFSFLDHKVHAIVSRFRHIRWSAW